MRRATSALPLRRKRDGDFAIAAGRARARHQAHAHQPGHEPRQGRGIDAGQIGKIDLALAAGGGEHRHHPPHRDAQPVRRQRFGAELIGDDGADPVHQIGQIIAEIELGGLLHGRRPSLARTTSA